MVSPLYFLFQFQTILFQLFQLFTIQLFTIHSSPLLMQAWVANFCFVDNYYTTYVFLCYD